MRIRRGRRRSCQAMYVAGGRQAELLLDLPAGMYSAEWSNTKTGIAMTTESAEHRGGTLRLISPAYEDDIALRIIAIGP